MMDPKQIEALLLEALTLDEVSVNVEGTHYKIIAISDQFDGLSKVRRQQSVYAPLMEKITDGTLHAMTIKAFTPTEWQKEKIFNQPI